MNENQKKALQIGIEMAAADAARMTQAKTRLTHKAIAAMETRTQLNAQGRVTRGLAWAEYAEEHVREITAKIGKVPEGVLADLLEQMSDDLIESGIQAIDMGVQKRERLANDRKLMVSRK